MLTEAVDNPDVAKMLYACLYVPHRPEAAPDAEALLALAHDFSPRAEVHAPHLVTLDVSGLSSLLGPPRTIGDELRTSAAGRGLYVHVAICASRAAAMILAAARAGVTVIDPGGEAAALAPLPLRALESALPLVQTASVQPLHTFRRWGLTTIGDIAALPADAIFARMGASGVAWHHLASGMDPRPLIPSGPDEVFEERLELQWPIEGLEPLSFVLGRLFDLLCAHLERRDRGVAALHVGLRLVTRETWTRRLELPAPIRDPRALRTLALLDLESHPPPAAIDAVTLAADPTPGRVLQYSLLTRALPAAERVSTLLARLTALMGEGRLGSPRLVDSYRPGAFEMAAFTTGTRGSGFGIRDSGPTPDPQPPTPGPDARGPRPEARGPGPDTLQSVLRRFRHPVAARVVVEDGRPARVTTDRRGCGGGRVEACAGPWRSSGEWWHVGGGVRPPAPNPQPPTPNPDRLGGRGAILPDPATSAHDREAQAEYIYALNFLVRDSPAALLRDRVAIPGPILETADERLQRLRPSPSANARGDSERGWGPASRKYWDIDEWDVALSDGAAYRILQDRETDRWYVSGIVD